MELAGSTWQSQDAHSGNVVFLHGMGGVGALWRPIAAHLENDYRVFAPDQRGHGGSRAGLFEATPKKVGFTPLDYGQDVVETMGLKNHHPAWIIGHSMGVRTAAAVAHLKPEWVKGLVCVDLGFSGQAGGSLGDSLARFVQTLPDHFESRTAMRDHLTATCPDPSIAQYLLAVAETLPDGRAGFRFDRRALIETIAAARDVSTRGWIRATALSGIPVLVLRGAESRVWSKEDYEEEKNQFRDLPNVHFEEVAGAGHGLPFEKRAEFVSRLRLFFQAESP